jgi:glycogen phosphorylase
MAKSGKAAPAIDTKTRIGSREGRDAGSIAWGFAEQLRFSLGVDSYTATDYDRYMSLSLTIRDRLIHQWIHTQQTHHDKEVKRVYYLSLEFLMGRAMGNNIINLGLWDETVGALEELGYSLEEIREQEVDAGLGNGGLGRLAACYLDSMATMDIPAFGYGLRYDYGIFRQEIDNGFQVEQPDDWLRKGNPWEIERPDVAVQVNFGGKVVPGTDRGRHVEHWVDTTPLIGIAYDIPIVGYGGRTVNTLRLWTAKTAEEFDFSDFNAGDYVEAVSAKVSAENLTKVLYPNDRLYLGKELRFRQQYLFVACSLSDILRRFKNSGLSWDQFPSMAAIQLNDTHPALAVPELMRLLLDAEGLDWDTAWRITTESFGYTNHTLMPEALEKWPVHMFEKLLPRHLAIIYEINHRFLERVTVRFGQNTDKMARMSLIQEGQERQVRMAYLSILGSHSTNGVAELHTKLLRERLVPDFAAMFPERFNNKTNGITQRRWLLKANPELADLITSAVGDDWITDFDALARLKPMADDAPFQEKIRKVKHANKVRLAEHLRREFEWHIDPDTVFDVQVKRIHEYKRQLLNALHIVMLYEGLRSGRITDMVPRTFLIGGKAAPGYAAAKLIIKFISNISRVINSDPQVNGRLAVYFVPNYRVSLAEKIIPACEVSEQISTAGTEASGTGNMKFMCNGALTVGTLDGANIEIVEEAGEENVYIFGLKAEEVQDLRPTYDPVSYYGNDDEIKAALDLAFSGLFNHGEPDIFDPIRAMLLEDGDTYMHMADLRSYADIHTRIGEEYRDRTLWTRKSILNIGSSGKFSSDRAIRQYAEEIWKVNPCPIEVEGDPEEILDEARRKAAQ